WMPYDMNIFCNLNHRENFKLYSSQSAGRLDDLKQGQVSLFVQCNQFYAVGTVLVHFCANCWLKKDNASIVSCDHVPIGKHIPSRIDNDPCSEATLRYLVILKICSQNQHNTRRDLPEDCYA